MMQALPKVVCWPNHFTNAKVVMKKIIAPLSGRMTLLFTTVAFSFSSLAHTASTAEPQQKQQRARKPNPAFAKVEDEPGLPRVLLIGDSISIGYTVPVQQLLKGKANVHRPPTNCGPTTRGLAEIEKWLGDGKWDVIHFNWGLHDLKYMGSNGENLADPAETGSHQQVPPKEYEANLKKLVARLKQTGARLIWRSTTPVPQGAKGRVVGDAEKYNAIAAKIMNENQIAIDDQYAFALPRLNEIQLKANVHFTADGSRELAKQTVAAIEQILKN